jgi:hypothetical protein
MALRTFLPLVLVIKQMPDLNVAVYPYKSSWRTDRRDIRDSGTKNASISTCLRLTTPFFFACTCVSAKVVWTVLEDVNNRASISPAPALTAGLPYEPTLDARVCDDGEKLRNSMVGMRFVEVFWSGYGSGLITC